MREFIVNNSKGIKDICKELKCIENVAINNDYSLTCKVKDDKEYELFRAILSKHLIKKYFMKCAIKIMKQKKYPQEGIDTFLEYDIVKDIDENPYFNLNTSILIDEYFKNLNVINIEAFMRFNMSGFKEEVKVIINYGECMTNNNNDDDDYDDMGSAFQNQEDTLSDMGQYLKENGVQVESFSEIDIVILNDEIVIKSKNGEEFTKDIIAEKLGIDLSYSVKNVVEGKLIQDVLFCVTFISIMGCKKVGVINQDKKFAETLCAYINMTGIPVDIEII